MTIKQFRSMSRGRVGQLLDSDVTLWRIPSIVFRAFGGLLLSGLVLALALPLFAQDGGHVRQIFAWLVMLACVTLCIAPEGRHLLPCRRVRSKS